jgi:hypothetical protein
MELLGMFPAEFYIMSDCIAMHTHQAAGGTHATAFHHMLQQRNLLLRRQLRTKQRRALALGEAFLTGAAIQEAQPLAFTEPPADRQVAGMAPTVIYTGAVLTAKSR